MSLIMSSSFWPLCPLSSKQTNKQTIKSQRKSYHTRNCPAALRKCSVPSVTLGGHRWLSQRPVASCPLAMGAATWAGSHTGSSHCWCGWKRNKRWTLSMYPLGVAPSHREQSIATNQLRSWDIKLQKKCYSSWLSPVTKDSSCFWWSQRGRTQDAACLATPKRMLVLRPHLEQ